MLLYLLGILIMVLGLALSIGLHEVGHLLPAKWFGVRVSQFMIGFGGTVFSRRVGETEYGLKWIPLGGYVSMAGMFPPERPGGRARTATTGLFETMIQEARTSASAEQDESRSFYRLPVLKRIVIMLGGPAMNLLIAIVLYAILLMGFGAAMATTTIASVSECVVPASAERTECEPGDAAAPGALAGVLPGDRIVSMNGEAISTWQRATEIIRASPGRDIALVVERDGAEIALSAQPLLTERPIPDARGQAQYDADGALITEPVGFLGIGSALEVVPQPITAVLPAVGENISLVTGIILTLPQRMIDVVNAAFGPEERDPNGPVSVVGVGRLAGEITSLDALSVESRAAGLVGLLASLNVALFVFNLIPLMPLDGGHVAGALFEWLRRGIARLFGRPDPGPFDAARFIPITLAVVLVLGVMSALLIYADIVKPISIL